MVERSVWNMGNTHWGHGGNDGLIHGKTWEEFWGEPAPEDAQYIISDADCWECQILNIRRWAYVTRGKGYK